MKCSKCGKEFGEGVNCQNCGVDRVTGLANYSSYGTSDYQGTNTSHYDSSYNSSTKTMVCYACGEIIPSDSEYCPYCRKKLYVKCPKCGNTYSSQFPACNMCGTNRSQYYKRERQKRVQEQKAHDDYYKNIMNKIEAQQKQKSETPEGRAELERERQIIDESKKKWKNGDFQQTKQRKGKQNATTGYFKLIGFICIFFGIVLVIVAISEHGSENFRINQGKELLCYIFAIACLIIGLVGISNKKP